MRILIVEDSAVLRESLAEGLSASGFAVDAAADGAEGLALARHNAYDVLVLDWMLPELDGIEVLGALQKKPNRPHVLLLTAKDQVADRVRGLNAGADDYLVKPFAFDELVARLRALVRRHYVERASILRIGALELDTAEHTAALRGTPLELSARQYALLEYLARKRGHTATREEIEDHVYGTHELPASNAVDATICLLRAKLGEDGKELIRTRRGQGYVLDAPAEPAS